MAEPGDHDYVRDEEEEQEQEEREDQDDLHGNRRRRARALAGEVGASTFAARASSDVQALALACHGSNICSLGLISAYVWQRCDGDSGTIVWRCTVRPLEGSAALPAEQAEAYMP